MKTQTQQDAEQLVSRSFPERRKYQGVCTIDIDLSDRRRPMENAITLAYCKQDRRKYLTEPERITAMSDFS